MNVEHECNINNITWDDLYQYPMKKKDVSTINNSVYNESNEHINTINDLSKQADARNDPIKETHIVYIIRTLSIGVGSLEPQGSTPLSTNLVTHVLTNSSEQLSMKSLSTINTFHSKAFVIGS